MNFKKLSIYCQVASALLLVGFIVRLFVDYFKDYQWGSAPFYVYVVERTFEFLIPAVIFFIIGKRMKKNTTGEFSDPSTKEE